MRPLPAGLITGVKAKLPDGANKHLARQPGGRMGANRTSMNKAESAYAWDLEIEKRAGTVLDYAFEPFAVRLAKKSYYWVDFLVQRPDGLECIEIKGHLEDDAAVKFKVAREMYPWFRWRMLRRQGGGWVEILK